MSASDSGIEWTAFGDHDPGAAPISTSPSTTPSSDSEEKPLHATINQGLITIRKNFVIGVLRFRIVYKAVTSINTYIHALKLRQAIAWISFIERYGVYLKTFAPANNGLKLIQEFYNCIYPEKGKSRPFADLAFRACMTTLSVFNMFLTGFAFDLTFSSVSCLSDFRDAKKESEKYDTLQQEKDALEKAIQYILLTLPAPDSTITADKKQAVLEDLNKQLNRYIEVNQELAKTRRTRNNTRWFAFANGISIIISCVFLVDPILGSLMKASLAVLRFSHMFLEFMYDSYCTHTRNCKADELGKTSPKPLTRIKSFIGVSVNTPTPTTTAVDSNPHLKKSIMAGVHAQQEEQHLENLKALDWKEMKELTPAFLTSLKTPFQPAIPVKINNTPSSTTDHNEYQNVANLGDALRIFQNRIAELPIATDAPTAVSSKTDSPTTASTAKASSKNQKKHPNPLLIDSMNMSRTPTTPKTPNSLLFYQGSPVMEESSNTPHSSNAFIECCPSSTTPTSPIKKLRNHSNRRSSSSLAHH